MDIKRTERGWVAYIVPTFNNRCFIRNTLLEYKDIKIVISILGFLKTTNLKDSEIIDLNRCYETKVFHAKREEDSIIGMQM